MEAIRLKKLYTLKEASDITGIHYRRIQRKAKKLNTKKLGREYMVDEEFMLENFNVLIDSSVSSVKMETVKSIDVNTSVNRGVNSQSHNELLNRIDKLQDAIMKHTQLFRNMATKMSRFEAMELQSISDDLKQETPEPPLQVYNNNYPPSTKDTIKDGEKIQGKPSMNDINFRSSYDANWNKNKD